MENVWILWYFPGIDIRLSFHMSDGELSNSFVFTSLL